MKKIIIIVVILIAIISSIIWIYVYHFNEKSNAYYWRSSHVEKGDVSVFVTATGSLAADTSVDIGVQVSGTISEIKVDFNYIVKKGQIIAVLDTNLYYAAKLDAKAAFDRAKIALDQAKREYDRTKNLFVNKVAAQADYDQALATWLTDSGNYISAKAQLYKADINLKYCTIRSPISGVVISRNVQVGNMVIASFNSPVLFTIAYDLKKMQVQADVDEADIGQIRQGQEAKFTVNAYSDLVFTGVVSQIRRQPVMVQNVVNYIVIIEVSNPDLKLMPGLTANSNIFINKSKNVLKVPSIALTFVPPLEYIRDSKVLSGFEKKFWMQKLRQMSELKKQQIVESNNSEGYIWI
ncbi:MAG: efflux RND transporter periplasmic adaptor subunit, partial [Bacteroidota bacterium]|nr:efflux RND transporter periplasmic adaptor subunit [Bacteroidota bacterium]